MLDTWIACLERFDNVGQAITKIRSIVVNVVERQMEFTDAKLIELRSAIQKSACSVSENRL